MGAGSFFKRIILGKKKVEEIEAKKAETSQQSNIPGLPQPPKSNLDISNLPDLSQNLQHESPQTQLVSQKLDTINAKLDVIDQRLKSIEARFQIPQEPSSQPKRFY